MGTYVVIFGIVGRRVRVRVILHVGREYVRIDRRRDVMMLRREKRSGGVLFKRRKFGGALEEKKGDGGGSYLFVKLLDIQVG